MEVVTDALMNSFGPRIQATRQPGRRKRLVRPSTISTSSSSTSMTFSWCNLSVWGCFVSLRRLQSYSSADGRAVAVAGVVVARVKLVADQGGALAADVLDLGQLRILHDAAGRVARVGGQDDAGAAGNLLGDLVRVDVVAVLFGQRDRNGGELKLSVSQRGASWAKGSPIHTFLNRDNISL